MTKEKRSFRFEMRKKDGASRTMVGHAAVFNQETDIGGWFREKILPGAFTDTIQTDDVRALFNHDVNHVLGRNTAGTLTMTEDETGLRVEIDPPDTQFARDLALSIERGDIDQMSFAFEIRNSQDVEWETGENGMLDLRTIKKVRLFDVSPVTFPAYEGTDIAMRSHDAWAKAQVPQSPPSPVATDPQNTTLLRLQIIGRMSA